MEVTWNVMFISQAMLFAMKSRDPRTKVGAIIVGPDNEIRSSGYNGYPRGIEYDYATPNKNLLVSHAERNALDNLTRMGLSAKGCKIYISCLPCLECTKSIIQCGIKEVIARPLPDLESKSDWIEKLNYSKQLLKDAQVNLLIYDGPVITEIKRLWDGREVGC